MPTPPFPEYDKPLLKTEARCWDHFNDEKQMLIELDNFIYRAKSLRGELRNKLISKIYEFLKENELDGDPHNFVDINKIK